MNRLLSLLCLAPVCARAGPPGVLPSLDASGTSLLDGAVPLDEDSAVAMGRVLGPVDRRVAAGVGALVRPEVPIELGVGLPTLTTGTDRPSVSPGPLMVVARTASIPKLTGVAVAGEAGLAVARLPGEPPSHLGGRLSVAPPDGPVRAIGNAGVSWFVDDRAVPWLGVGMVLPTSVQVAAEGVLTLEGDWSVSLQGSGSVRGIGLLVGVERLQLRSGADAYSAVGRVTVRFGSAAGDREDAS